MALEPLPPPFKDVRYQRQFEGGAYAVSEEEFEDWEPQVGPSPLSLFFFLLLPQSLPAANHTSPFMKTPLLVSPPSYCLPSADRRPLYLC